MKDLMDSAARPRRDIGDLLAAGFGTTVAMWGLAYLGGMPGVAVPDSGLLAALLVVIIAASVWFGHASHRGVAGGAAVGLVVALLNMLVLGSLLGGRKSGHVDSRTIWLIPLWFGVAAILFGAGAGVGTMLRVPGRPKREWLATFASVAIGATVLLIAAGGIVTGTEAGLAVPDWPNSFGYNMFLFPRSQMTGGVYYEHAHRLFGSLVGLTVLVFAIYIQFVEQRRWLRGLALLALVVVITQGVLGGLRVTEKHMVLAMLHGILAQLFFGTLVAIRIFCGRTWHAAPLAEPIVSAGLDRRLGLVLLAALLTQLVLGAAQRHLAWGLQLHITFAVLVASLAITLGARSWGLYERHRLLSRLGVALIWLASVQFALGFASFLFVGDAQPGDVRSPLRVAVTTAHQTLGAILLASSVALNLWLWRLIAPVGMHDRALLVQRA